LHYHHGFRQVATTAYLIADHSFRPIATTAYLLFKKYWLEANRTYSVFAFKRKPAGLTLIAPKAYLLSKKLTYPVQRNLVGQAAVGAAFITDLYGPI